MELISGFWSSMQLTNMQLSNMQLSDTVCNDSAKGIDDVALNKK